MTDKSNKLVKISDTHYVIVDMSEKGRKGYNYNFALNKIDNLSRNYDESYSENSFLRKITHSTEPLELTKTVTVDKLVFNKIKSISLSEVEEVINEYNLDDLIFNKFNKQDKYTFNEFKDVFILGFKAHRELVKDNLFTLEDMKKISQAAFTVKSNNETLIDDFDKWFNKKMQSLLLKAEWDLEFDENGKMLIKC
jgi:hypothetical protein